MKGQTSTEEQEWRTTGDADLDALGTWIWDLERETFTCSEEIMDLAGLAPTELDGHVRLFLALAPQPRRHTFCETILRRANQGLAFTERVDLQLPDGRACQVKVAGHPFRDTLHKPRRIVGTLSRIGSGTEPKWDVGQFGSG